MMNPFEEWTLDKSLMDEPMTDMLNDWENERNDLIAAIRAYLFIIDNDKTNHGQFGSVEKALQKLRELVK